MVLHLVCLFVSSANLINYICFKRALAAFMIFFYIKAYDTRPSIHQSLSVLPLPSLPLCLFLSESSLSLSLSLSLPLSVSSTAAFPSTLPASSSLSLSLPHFLPSSTNLRSLPLLFLLWTWTNAIWFLELQQRLASTSNQFNPPTHSAGTCQACRLPQPHWQSSPLIGNSPSQQNQLACS